MLSRLCKNNKKKKIWSPYKDSWVDNNILSESEVLANDKLCRVANVAPIKPKLKLVKRKGTDRLNFSDWKRKIITKIKKKEAIMLYKNVLVERSIIYDYTIFNLKKIFF